MTRTQVRWSPTTLSPLTVDLGPNIWPYLNAPGGQLLEVAGTGDPGNPRHMTIGALASGAVAPENSTVGTGYTLHPGSAGRAFPSTNVALPQTSLTFAQDISVAIAQSGYPGWAGSAQYRCFNTLGAAQDITYQTVMSNGDGTCTLGGCSGGTGTLDSTRMCGPTPRPHTAGSYNGWTIVQGQVAGGLVIDGPGVNVGGVLLSPGTSDGYLAFDEFSSRLVLAGVNFRNTACYLGTFSDTTIVKPSSTCDRVRLWYCDFMGWTALTGWTTDAHLPFFNAGGTNDGQWGCTYHNNVTSPVRLANGDCLVRGMKQLDWQGQFENATWNHMDCAEMFAGGAGESLAGTVKDSCFAPGSWHLITNVQANNQTATYEIDNTWWPIDGTKATSPTYLQLNADGASSTMTVTCSGFNIWRLDGTTIVSPGYAEAAPYGSGSSVNGNTNPNSPPALAGLVYTSPPVVGGSGNGDPASILADANNPANVWMGANPYPNLLSYMGSSTDAGWT